MSGLDQSADVSGSCARNSAATNDRFALLIWALSSPLCKNIPIPTRPKSLTYPRRLVPHEGRLAIVTDAGRDAVDAKVLQTRALFADGEVVWS
jgi:hypothetical protein